MAQAASDAQQYFLGLGGEQTGPHSAAEIIEKIRAGQIQTDALVWYEGLSEWQPLQSLSPFSEAFAGGTPAAAAPVAAVPNPAPAAAAPAPAAAAPKKVKAPVPSKDTEDYTHVSTFAEGSEAAPVFDAEEGAFFKPFLADEAKLKKLAVVVVVGLGLLIFCVKTLFFNADELPPPVIQTPKMSSRAGDLRKALSELLVTPTPSVETLKRLAKEDPNDEIGRSAVNAVVDYYKVHAPVEAGRLLMQVNRPEEAIKFFMGEPPAYPEAETAFVKAAEATTDPAKKKEYLLKSIELLISPLNNNERAAAQLQVYEKAFPGEPHPYGYYLKSPEDKLKDLFERISFYFVQNLSAFIETELPKINLMSKPVVELRKEADGKYRVVGSYSGEITLNQDRLKKIFFQFWLSNNQWVLVDTNLTSERRKFTQLEREKQKSNSLGAPEMLKGLEKMFRDQFPKKSLHEQVLNSDKVK